MNKQYIATEVETTDFLVNIAQLQYICLSENYISKTKDQIYYAVFSSSDNLLSIGTEIRRGPYSQHRFDIPITRSALLNAYKYEYRNRSPSVSLFRTEELAFEYLLNSSEDSPSNPSGLCYLEWMDDDFEKSRIKTTPVYKVQIVHTSFKFDTWLEEDQLVRAQEFKKNEHLDSISSPPSVYASNLLPLCHFQKTTAMKLQH